MGINPPIDVPAVDSKNCFVPDWYDRFKYLDALQPLSDIVFPDPVDISGKSNITRTENAQTGTTYTFALTDAGNIVTFNNASAVTVTVPPNSSVAFPNGTQIDIGQIGAGKVTLTPGSGVTIVSISSQLSLAAQYAGGTLIKRGTNSWWLTGSLIP